MATKDTTGQKLTARVLELVTAHTERTFTPADVAAEVGAERERVTYTLINLHRRGQLDKVAPGQYKAAAGGAKPATKKPAAKKAAVKKPAAKKAPAKRAAAESAAPQQSAVEQAVPAAPARKALAKKAAKRSAPRVAPTAAAVPASAPADGPTLRWVGRLSDGRGLLEVDGALWEARPLS